MHYYTDGNGRLSESSSPTPPTQGGPWVEVSAEAYHADLTGAMVDVQIAMESSAAAQSDSRAALARSVYDEMVEVHPITALAIAQIVYPPFTLED